MLATFVSCGDVQSTSVLGLWFPDADSKVTSFLGYLWPFLCPVQCQFRKW